MNDEPKHKHRKYWLLCLFAVFIAILGVILPELDTKPITYLNASNISTTGATANGSLQDITEINNGHYIVNETNAQPFYVIVNFTNITNFSFIEVKARYFSESGTPSSHIVDLEIYCEVDNEYEDVFFLENAVEWRYFTRHFPDSSHFIDHSGNVSIKFNHSANGNVNHRLWIDVVRLIILPQYAQNTVTLNQYFNSTVTGGGGGVSFNNATTDLNGTDLRNGTISNYTTLDFLNSSLNNKVNKSGDTGLSGTFVYNTTNKTTIIINMSSDNRGVGSLVSTSADAYFSLWENGTQMSRFAVKGTQWWNVDNTGYISYSTPGGMPGITYLSSSYPTTPYSRTDIWVSSQGLNLRAQYFNPGASTTNTILLGNDGNVTVSKLSGVGIAYMCVNATGVLYRGNPGC